MDSASHVVNREGLAMFVHECMDRPAVTLQPNATFHEALDLMEQQGHRRFVVVDDKRKLTGIVTDIDLKQALPSPVNSLNKWELRYMLSHIQVKDVMTKKVITTTADTPIETAVHLMMHHRIGGLPVVDGHHRIKGMITVSNVLRVFFGKEKETGSFFPGKT